MTNSPFEIKSRFTPGTPSKTTSINSPLSRPGPRPHRPNAPPASLSLRRIIGTTTTSSSGLACHYNSSRFAYCAGSAAVLAQIDDGGDISYRFFRAQPTAIPIHPCVSFYNPTTPTGTPESRRRTNLPFRQGTDERSSNGSSRRVWGEEGSSKAWSARERVKAVSCVDLSPNGKFLAVGETGYSPRVNIFSTLAGAPTDIPLSILTEHSFGVRCVAFSPNSKWLATLGDINDGFLFIFSISPKTGAARLHFTNRCTASVLDMAWCANNLITVGTRYVKVWRVGEPYSTPQAKQGRSLLDADGNASPVPKTLLGRNSLLGSFVDSNFISVSPISNTEAILRTKTGAICLLDDRNGNQELKYIRQLSSPTAFAAVDFDGQTAWFSDGNGQLSSESFEDIRIARENRLADGSRAKEEAIAKINPSTPAAVDRFCAFRSPLGSGSRKRKRHKAVIASICLPNKIVSIDDERTLRVASLSHTIQPVDSHILSILTLPAHNDAIQGVIPLPSKTAFGDYITWSLGGTVNFWSLDGSLRRSETIALEQPDQPSPGHDEYINELKLICVSDDAQWIFSGDRLGVLQVAECQSWTSSKARAHSAEVTDIALHASELSLLVATCSRDRTVQLLRHSGEGLELLQTFDEHVGAVSAVNFVDDFLVSASSDRTVIIRQRLSRANDDATCMLAFVTVRIITLKASPTSIAFPEPNVLVVATMDRQILTFNMTSGVAMDGFKAFDAEGEDAVILSSLSISSMKDSSASRRILAGFSSIDKSIRLYDFDRGLLLARELGHTEGISDVALIDHTNEAIGQDRKILVSTGLDGLIMVWDASMASPRLPSTPLQELSQGQDRTSHDLDSTPIRESMLKRPPLRKVLSKLDLADFSSHISSATSVHDASPTRLKKKTSLYSLASCKLNGSPVVPLRSEIFTTKGHVSAEPVSDGVVSSFSSSNIVNNANIPRQPSPPPTDWHARADASEEGRQLGRLYLGERSPSPPPASPSLPTTPKTVNRANKGRLRRPPSIPSDLRGQSHTSTRRKSIGNVNEFGSLGMASEQVCRTLRAYQKKIKAAPSTEQLRLDEVEVELLATLRVVQERHSRNENRTTKAGTENELDNLANLMRISRLDQRSEGRTPTQEVLCNGHHSSKT